MNSSDEAIEALNNLLADHPMWVGDGGEPLEFHPLREERISQFIEDARPIFGALATRVRAEAVADERQRPATVWLVHHGADPLPHRRFSCGKFWPYVEVFSQWGDAFKRLGELSELGIPTMFEEVGLAGGSVPVAAPQPAVCASWVSSHQDDEDVSRCGDPAVSEWWSTSGEWQPICARHSEGVPGDRLRTLAAGPVAPCERCPKDGATFEAHYDYGFADGRAEAVSAERQRIEAMIRADRGDAYMYNSGYCSDDWGNESGVIHGWHRDYFAGLVAVPVATPAACRDSETLGLRVAGCDRCAGAACELPGPVATPTEPAERHVCSEKPCRVEHHAWYGQLCTVPGCIEDWCIGAKQEPPASPVPAEQPVDEVRCPSCGATIRARMSDAGSVPTGQEAEHG